MPTFQEKPNQGLMNVLRATLAVPLVLLGACESEQAPQEKAAPVEITAVEIEAHDVPVTREFVGKTASSRRVEIRSRVTGFLDKREYVEGTMVEEGQVLFQMDKKPFEAQLQAAEAELGQQQARLENATANLARVEPLARENAVAQKELDDALAYYRESAAAVEAAKASLTQTKLDLGYTTITSPVTGQSSFSTQQEGAYIGFGADSLLTYVARLSPMRVEFSVSENQILKFQQQKESGQIREPEDGNFVVEIILADGSVFPHTGHLTFADASISEETGTFLVRAEFDNPEGVLRPGMFVRAHLKGAVRPDAILLPQRAVQQGAQGSFVWVIDGDGKAEFRPVVTGPWHDDQWFIEDGLQVGETVAVEGALKLRAGAPVTIVEPEKPEGSDKAAGGEPPAGDDAPGEHATGESKAGNDDQEKDAK